MRNGEVSSMSNTAKLKPATTASEVIANALKYWGHGGRRWTAGTLASGSKVCFYGGLSAGAYGTTVSSNGKVTFGEMQYADDIDRKYPEEQSTEDKAYKRAEKFVLDELEAQGFDRDIVEFNDSEGSYYSESLYALEVEIEEIEEEIQDRVSEGMPVKRLKAKRDKLKAKYKKLADSQTAVAGTFKGVRTIACGALKRALKAGE